MTPEYKPPLGLLPVKDAQEYVNETYAALWMDCWEVYEIAHILRTIGVTAERVERAEAWAHENLFSKRQKARDAS